MTEKKCSIEGTGIFSLKPKRFRTWAQNIHKIKAVYQNIDTQVRVNEHLSQTFKAGVWQECLLYLVVYILFAEIFLENI